MICFAIASVFPFLRRKASPKMLRTEGWSGGSVVIFKSSLIFEERQWGIVSTSFKKRSTDSENKIAEELDQPPHSY